MMDERDQRFLRTLTKLAVALGLTVLVAVAAVQWLPGVWQGWVAAPIGLWLIFVWALRDTPFDLFGWRKRLRASRTQRRERTFPLLLWPVRLARSGVGVGHR
jgi:archaellum biogenesis protein FlaJ (TadC family)